MVTLYFLLLACGTTEAPGDAPSHSPAPTPVAAPAPEPAEPSPSASIEAPDGYVAMTLLMPAETLGDGVVTGSMVDLVAGEGSAELLVAKEVEVLAMAEEERGHKVTLALTADHRAQLLGGQLPGRPRVLVHQ